MRILVTGSEGFIGKRLVARLRSHGTDEVHGLDLKTGRDVLTDPLADDYDRVFHLAAQTDAQTEDVEHDALTNVIGTLRILKRYGSRVVFASSSLVNYQTSGYAISKAAGERYAAIYGAAVVRLCNIFGPGGHSFMEVCQEADVITIHGDGSALRTWAPHYEAVNALISAEAGQVSVLGGYTCTIREIAAGFHKKIVYDGSKSPGVIFAPQLPKTS